ncbi:MAG: phosphoserine transaminase [Thalassobaculaceae bacterium]
MKPTALPRVPFFSSGPCAKRPGWTTEVLKGASIGRSHRSTVAKRKLNQLITLTREILELPEDRLVGIVPASDTGAIEMAMWSLLGERAVDLLAWESFGKEWVIDVTKQLKLKEARVFSADYGAIPDLNLVNFFHDVVFTWNGTTSGVRVPNGDWIPADRQGLTLCDATSAVFSQHIPWSKIDVATFSWQKVLGGEGAHGMLILSPRAVKRLETYTPEWPIPKIFRLKSKGSLNEAIFKGATINTPSMICVEDALDALTWIKNIGGIEASIQRSNKNLSVIEHWVRHSYWADFLAKAPDTRSNTSICLQIVDPWFWSLGKKDQVAVPKKIESILEENLAAFDINGYRDAPPGLRIWGGATVEVDDITALLPWLDWAYEEVKAAY